MRLQVIAGQQLVLRIGIARQLLKQRAGRGPVPHLQQGAGTGIADDVQLCGAILVIPQDEEDFLRLIVLLRVQQLHGVHVPGLLELLGAVAVGAQLLVQGGGLGVFPLRRQAAGQGIAGLLQFFRAVAIVGNLAEALHRSLVVLALISAVGRLIHAFQLQGRHILVVLRQLIQVPPGQVELHVAQRLGGQAVQAGKILIVRVLEAGNLRKQRRRLLKVAPGHGLHGGGVDAPVGLIRRIGIVPRQEEFLTGTGHVVFLAVLLALHVMGLLDCLRRVLVIGKSLQAAQRFVGVARLDGLQGRAVERFLGQFLRVLIIAQGQQRFPGLVIRAVLQQGAGQQIVTSCFFIRTVLITVQCRKQLPGFLHPAVLQHQPRTEIIRLVHQCPAVLIVAEGGKDLPGFVDRRFVPRVQLDLGGIVAAPQHSLLRVTVIPHGGEGFLRLTEAALLHGRDRLTVAHIGPHLKGGHIHQRRAQGHHHRHGHGPAVFLPALFMLLLPLQLQARGVLPRSLGLQIKLLFPLGGHFFDGLAVILRKHLLLFPVAAGAGVGGGIVGAAAHTQPHALLLRRKAHGAGARGIAQHFQGAAVGQGVGGILRQRPLAPPPHAVVVKPDLLNQHLCPLGMAIPVHGYGKGEGLVSLAMKVMGAEHHPALLLAALVPENHRYFHRGHGFLRQIVQRHVAGGIVLPGHIAAPPFHRAGQINSHRFVPLVSCGRMKVIR